MVALEEREAKSPSGEAAAAVRVGAAPKVRLRRRPDAFAENNQPNTFRNSAATSRTQTCASSTILPMLMKP